MTVGDILEENERSYRERYGRSLRDKWRYAVESGELTTDILSYYESYYGNNEAICDIEPDQKNTLLLFVCGIGDHSYIENAKRMMPVVSRIVIYEPDDTGFLYLCTRTDISEIINDERIDLVIYEDGAEERIINLLNHIISAENVDHIKARIASGFEAIYEEVFSFLYQHLQRRVDEIKLQINMYKDYGCEPCKNELYALSTLNENCTIKDFFRSIPNRALPVILVGAGPSLDKNITELEKAKGKALIVAASHAVKSFSKAGIVPDLVAEIEPAADLGFLDDDTERQYRLLLSAKCARSSQIHYKGKCIYFGFEKDFLPFSFDDHTGEYEISGGSVMTDMFDLFVMNGFRTIILVGQDLAYGEGGVTHTDAEIQQSAYATKRIPVPGINGGTVYSRYDWIRYRDYLEMRIHQFPEVNVIDATEGGVMIGGTEVMTLSQAVGHTCTGVFSLTDWLDGTPRAFDEEQYRLLISEIESIISRLRTSINEIREIINTGHKIIKYIKEGKNSNPEFNKLCIRYDRIYHSVLDDDHTKWLIYYSEGELQDYIQEKCLYEGAANIIGKVESELRMFRILEKRAPELLIYMESLFDQGKLK